MSNLGIAAILALVICGTFVIIAIPTLIVINRRIARCTQSVPGTFVGERTYRIGKTTTFIPIVRYTVDNVQYECEASYAEGLGGFKTPPEGTPLTVFYDPFDITYVWATKSGTFGQRTAMKVLLWVGVFGCAISGAYLLALYLMR
ncbi:MAG: hypothetical protein Q4A01_06840 [Coriobacteriales bacterium]|nr:hypothetical protein [Coriobacteriales bacterium]